jgi:hypothetical protein
MDILRLVKSFEMDITCLLGYYLKQTRLICSEYFEISNIPRTIDK